MTRRERVPSGAGEAADAGVGEVDRLFLSIACAVFAAGRYTFSPAWRLAAGAVPHYRLFVGVEGRGVFTVGEERHGLAPGGVILVPPGTRHEGRHESAERLTAYVIDFEAKLHGILDVPEFCGLPVALMPGETRRPKIAQSAEAIVRHLGLLIPGYQLAIHTHCVRLLDLLWKETLAREVQSGHGGALGPGGAPGAAAARRGDLLRFRPVFQLVERRYRERLTLGELAAAVHLHPAYFSATFKRVAGVGPHEYVSRYRLERARDLLVASDLPLGEIARRTGFYDAAHLIRAFRRREGVSPGRYRRARGA